MSGLILSFSHAPSGGYPVRDYAPHYLHQLTFQLGKLPSENVLELALRHAIAIEDDTLRRRSLLCRGAKKQRWRYCLEEGKEDDLRTKGNEAVRE